MPSAVSWYSVSFGAGENDPLSSVVASSSVKVGLGRMGVTLGVVAWPDIEDLQ